MRYQDTHPHYHEITIDEHVRLVTPSLDHAEQSLAWVSQLEVVQYMGADFPRPSLEGERKRLEEILANASEYSWMIDMDGRVIGNVCINEIDKKTSKDGVRSGNLTVLIGKRDAWGKGLGTLVSKAVLDWAFTEAGFQAMHARALQENVGSIRTLQKLGFSEIGTEPYEGLVQGKKSVWRRFEIKSYLYLKN